MGVMRDGRICCKTIKTNNIIPTPIKTNSQFQRWKVLFIGSGNGRSLLITRHNGSKTKTKKPIGRLADGL